MTMASYANKNGFINDEKNTKQEPELWWNAPVSISVPTIWISD